MLVLNNKKVEKFAREQIERGNNVRWDGWELVFFRPDRRAITDQNGVWNRLAGTYGYESRVSPDEKGLWRIDYRNVKRPSRGSTRS